MVEYTRCLLLTYNFKMKQLRRDSRDGATDECSGGGYKRKLFHVGFTPLRKWLPK